MLQAQRSRLEVLLRGVRFDFPPLCAYENSFRLFFFGNDTQGANGWSPAHDASESLFINLFLLSEIFF